MAISANLGQSWSSVENQNDIFKFCDTENAIYGISNNKIFISRNNKDFEEIKSGFKAASITQITELSNTIWVNANGKYFQRPISISNWVEIECEYLASTESGEILMVKNGIPRYSHNGGNSYTLIPYQEFGPFLPEFNVVSAAKGMMFLSDGYFNYYSSDFGVNWSHFILTGATDPKLLNMDFSGGKFLGGVIPHENGGRLYHSVDGIQWIKLPQAFEVNYYNHTSTFPSLLHFHQDNFFVFINSTLWRLTAGISSWEKITLTGNNPDEEFIQAITLETHGNLLIAGVHGYGVFISDDLGESWNEANQGLENYKILSSSIINDTLYLGVQGGIWRRPLIEFGLSGLNNSFEVPTVLMFPNPMIEEINIETNSLKTEHEVTITVLDISGKPIMERKINESINNKIDVKNLAPGVYFITFNNGALTKKMIKI